MSVFIAFDVAKGSSCHSGCCFRVHAFLLAWQLLVLLLQLLLVVVVLCL